MQPAKAPKFAAFAGGALVHLFAWGHAFDANRRYSRIDYGVFTNHSHLALDTGG
jgi:hypothetical protein